jgi:hypothetical protein
MIGDFQGWRPWLKQLESRRILLLRPMRGLKGVVTKSVKPTGDGGRTVMVTAMGIEKHAAYYRGYQPDDRSVFPVAIVLATTVALWLLVYLVSTVGPHGKPETAKSPHPSYAVSRPANP